MMEYISNIKRNFKRIDHDIYILKILLLSYYDHENELKLAYVENVNSNLKKEVSEYRESSPVELLNQIQNDCDTIMKLIKEEQEDLYGIFSVPSMIFLDNLKFDEVVSFYEQLKNALKTYPTLQQASKELLSTEPLVWSLFIDDLLLYIDKYATKQIIRLLPLQKLKEKSLLKKYSNIDCMETFKYLRLTVKYVMDCNPIAFYGLNSRFDKIKFTYYIMVTGASVNNG